MRHYIEQNHLTGELSGWILSYTSPENWQAVDNKLVNFVIIGGHVNGEYIKSSESRHGLKYLSLTCTYGGYVIFSLEKLYYHKPIVRLLAEEQTLEKFIIVPEAKIRVTIHARGLSCKQS